MFVFYSDFWLLYPEFFLIILGGRRRESNPPIPLEQDSTVLKTGRATGPYPLPKRQLGITNCKCRANLQVCIKKQG
ncbi:MAG: hypothetical protein A3G39_03400 [Deltaproteobacteria bacterium RIFCSPLOWO2_12_FULL_43_16]|nr:MAG: hypothetical protein A2Z89_07750 [Deltaproteobacteria bacterium GWA2_43_19]OGQ10692.1 MAG: hypothetical protein A3D30_03275 [Deltaproteobacteria bacterium RIFCSPHIGHO2_02_FULL_43_33]OGQ33467.1 MAG: hypothetical protein A3A85_00540 [Deltaproteobacteria bacterium RIFCSPLOWO2_01_FULL_42_9]OGQ60009.1 MAG: hypothetical protein A3G39_03400 [Deltaproteobacteria bacterium RIFCSPLOWO2_12_FULL_43_16]HBR17041.1 hypothetical protein [Deltaproteobacteria bacterium]